MIRRLIIYNYILCFLSIGFCLLIARDIRRLADAVPVLLNNNALEHETWVTALFIWILTCFGVPIASLLKMHESRIRRTHHAPSIFSLFKLHISPRWWHCSSSSHVIGIIEGAQCHEEGTVIPWSAVEHLTNDDRLYVKRLVEDFVHVQHTDDGVVKFVEKSAWLPVFSGLFLCALFFLSALWAFAEVLNEAKTSNDQMLPTFALGKALTEWVSNFVLWIFGLGLSYEYDARAALRHGGIIHRNIQGQY
ncbi:hypothetical protein FGB62_124g024 [Gracilaria domingensis]|nr:hypothetical protein FGB62_124g024 [Gracilaria domingensis]